jgi:tetratricopeptide (TPR) repeat protein
MALAGELAGALASRQAAAAHEALLADRFEPALRAASRALSLSPYQEQAQYTQLVALKRLGRRRELSEAARRAAAWHPDRSGIAQLQAETAWNLGRPAEAAQAMGDLLWLTPLPEHNGVAAWRLETLAGRAVWGDHDPRVRAAAVRTLTLLDADGALGATDRQGALGDGAAALRAAGAPLAAQER